MLRLLSSSNLYLGSAKCSKTAAIIQLNSNFTPKAFRIPNSSSRGARERTRLLVVASGFSICEQLEMRDESCTHHFLTQSHRKNKKKSRTTEDTSSTYVAVQF
mmetsp:Transcript_14628/g.18686  ORF Transcript_14628/g.18686 Transcript_14628/m.18686 type:complete len:103 (+) Transcript_14628:88-396(+)